MCNTLKNTYKLSDSREVFRPRKVVARVGTGTTLLFQPFSLVLRLLGEDGVHQWTTSWPLPAWCHRACILGQDWPPSHNTRGQRLRARRLFQGWPPDSNGGGSNAHNGTPWQSRDRVRQGRDKVRRRRDRVRRGRDCVRRGRGITKVPVLCPVHPAKVGTGQHPMPGEHLRRGEWQAQPRSTVVTTSGHSRRVREPVVYFGRHRSKKLRRSSDPIGASVRPFCKPRRTAGSRNGPADRRPSCFSPPPTWRYGPSTQSRTAA